MNYLMVCFRPSRSLQDNFFSWFIMTVGHLTRQKSNFFSLLRFQAKTKRSLLLLPLSFSKPNCTFSSNSEPNGTYLEKAKRVMSLFKFCSTMKDLKQIHARIIQLGFDQDLFVLAKMVEFCSVQGDMDYSVSVFDRIENPDGFLWNTIIRGFGKTDQPHKSVVFFKRMQKKGELADNFTFAFLLKVSGQLSSDKLGKQIHSSALKHGVDSHVFVRNTLIHMYGMFGEFENALQLFDEIPSPDLVAWNAILDCHVYCGKFKEALDLFLRMLQRGTQPDDATFVATLSACSSLGALDFGRWVHSYIDNIGFGSIVSVSNLLVHMYAKCGAVEEAYETFDKVKEKNLVSWNTMILAFATHGRVNEALALFSKMLETKLQRPDGITFLSVLCACSHGGMVDEGRRYFDMMSKLYHVKPTVKHYGCMVDMLGRAGLLEEAYQLIKSMTKECNAIVWRTLLAACRTHGNIELGEKVREHILLVEPYHSSDYVLLANMYASAGQWNDAIGVRETMRDRQVQKPDPGSSVIGKSSSDWVGY